MYSREADKGGHFAAGTADAFLRKSSYEPLNNCAKPEQVARNKRTGRSDPNWPDWYADYIVREQAGAELPS